MYSRVPHKLTSDIWHLVWERSPRAASRAVQTPLRWNLVSRHRRFQTASSDSVLLVSPDIRNLHYVVSPVTLREESPVFSSRSEVRWMFQTVKSSAAINLDQLPGDGRLQKRSSTAVSFERRLYWWFLEMYHICNICQDAPVTENKLS